MIPAVVHANGTARVQTLDPGAQPVPGRRARLLRGADRRPGPDQHLAQRQGQADQRHPADGHGVPGLQRPRRADARRRLVGEQVRIGYSFWGFLGPGITDTPDGGRSHRAPSSTASPPPGTTSCSSSPTATWTRRATTCAGRYAWDAGLPDIDALFLEWRWPITGRNTTPCGSPGHTCDLHRQDELVAHYTPGARSRRMHVGQGPATRPPRSPLRSLAQRDRLRARAGAQPRRGQPAVPRRRRRRWTPLTRWPWPRCPGRCRWSTPATSTTATRRSAGSSPRPPPGTAPGRREVDPHRAVAARQLHRPMRVPRGAASCTSRRWPRCCCCPTGTPGPGR